MGVLDALKGYAPKISDDTDFGPFACAGVGVIMEGDRNTGVKESTGEQFDWFKIKYKIGTVVEGDVDLVGRYDSLSYSMTDKTWDSGKTTAGADNFIKLMNNLLTMGYEFIQPKDCTEEELYNAMTIHLQGLSDKTFNVRCSVTKAGNQGRKVVDKIIIREAKKDEDIPF